MSVLPDTDIRQIEFCESHLPVWEADPAAVGLTPAQVQVLRDRTLAARAAFDAALIARQSSMAATTTLRGRAAEMRGTAAGLIRVVKAFAALNTRPEAIYAQAQLPVPASPSPLPIPGKPTNISAILNPDGTITLRWRARNSAPTSGVFFTILRRLPGERTYTSIGNAATGARGFGSFTDEDLPSSASGNGVKYIIQAQRGRGRKGATNNGMILGEPSEAFVVQFGNVGAGGGVGNGLKVAA